MKRGIRRTMLAFSFLLAATFLFSGAKNTYAAAPDTPHKYSKTPGSMVCLTIDDGFSKEDVIADLNILRENKVHCTFFVVGCMLTKFPDVWRQAIRDGNEICYHTMYHHDISQWSNQRIENDFNRWVETAHAVLGADYVIPKFVRFPGGFGSGQSRMLNLFDSMGYKVIYWDVDTFSGAYTKHANIVNYIEKNTKSGSIILTHFRKFDSSAMSSYIAWLKQNFTLGTLTQAFSISGRDTSVSRLAVNGKDQRSVWQYADVFSVTARFFANFLSMRRI